MYNNDDLKTGLDFYFPEQKVFSKFPERISNGGHLDQTDVLLILKWKLPFVKVSNVRTIDEENLLKINGAILEADKVGKEIYALNILVGVPGIKLATATAILTLCYPDKFTIIDVRVLLLLDYKGDDVKTEKWSTNEYFDEFLPQVKAKQKQWGCSLRDADRALWGLSVKKRFDALIDQASQIR